jgi:hypothetical protein
LATQPIEFGQKRQIASQTLAQFGVIAAEPIDLGRVRALQGLIESLQQSDIIVAQLVIISRSHGFLHLHVTSSR